MRELIEMCRLRDAYFAECEVRAARHALRAAQEKLRAAQAKLRSCEQWCSLCEQKKRDSGAYMASTWRDS